MSALHRAWLADQADKAAQATQPAPAGPQTADDWHRAISQPTPAMRAAWAYLQDSLARARAARAATPTDHPKD